MRKFYLKHIMHMRFDRFVINKENICDTCKTIDQCITADLLYKEETIVNKEINDNALKMRSMRITYCKNCIGDVIAKYLKNLFIIRNSII